MRNVWNLLVILATVAVGLSSPCVFAANLSPGLSNAIIVAQSGEYDEYFAAFAVSSPRDRVLASARILSLFTQAGAAEQVHLANIFLGGLAYDDTRSYVLEKMVDPLFHKSAIAVQAKPYILSLEPGSAQRYSVIKAAALAGLTKAELGAIVSIPSKSLDPKTEINYFNSYSWALQLYNVMTGDASASRRVLAVVADVSADVIRSQPSILSDLVFTGDVKLVEYVIDVLIAGDDKADWHGDYGVMSMREVAARAVLMLPDARLAKWRGSHLSETDVAEIREIYVKDRSAALLAKSASPLVNGDSSLGLVADDSMVDVAFPTRNNPEGDHASKASDLVYWACAFAVVILIAFFFNGRRK